jgi:hypothetical protein
LEHEGVEGRMFYAQFPPGTVVGIEATFPAHWFERLLGEWEHELWVGKAARAYISYLQCPADAFRNAAATLAQRVGEFGASSLLVRDWAEAQDCVFPNCAALEGTPFLTHNWTTPGQTDQNGRFLHAAFDLLDGRYSATTWANQTRYWYKWGGQILGG